MTPKDPFLEGTFWDKFWRPIRSRALLFTPDEFTPKIFFCGWRNEKSCDFWNEMVVSQLAAAVVFRKAWVSIKFFAR